MEGVLPPDDPETEQIKKLPSLEGILSTAQTEQIKKLPSLEGLRFCRHCDKYIPEEAFNGNGPRRYLCNEHLKKHTSLLRLSDPIRKAITLLKQRAWADLRWFNQTRIEISARQLEDMLNEDQIDTPANWALIPINPKNPISQKNVKIVNNDARKRIVAAWRHGNNPQIYKDVLETLDSA